MFNTFFCISIFIYKFCKSKINGKIKIESIFIITYGFNEKATITISSIKEENTMLCIQRNIKKIDGKIIEEQEENIKIEKNNIKKLYNVIVIFTILRIYGENLKKI